MDEGSIPKITHRELRNQSGEVLRRAEAGQILIVTSHGRPVAALGPTDTFSSGRLTPARIKGGFASLPRSKISVPTADVLNDLRSES